MHNSVSNIREPMTIFNLDEEPLPKHYPVTRILNIKKTLKISRGIYTKGA